MKHKTYNFYLLADLGTVRSSFQKYFILILICNFLISCLNAQSGSAKESKYYLSSDAAEDILTLAEQLYKSGKFKESVAKIRPYYEAKRNNLSEEIKMFRTNNKASACRILAKNYLALDMETECYQQTEELLLLAPDYDPDLAGEPPLFSQQVSKVKEDLLRTKISSVSKTAEKIELVPATISIITQEDIRKRGYQNIEEIFDDLSGFNISKSEGLSYTNLYQRGYRSAANTDRTLFLIDGVEDNDLWTNRVTLSRQYPITSIKRIEIIYGPASTIYGSNAYTGVINIVTKGETDLFEGKNKIAVTSMMNYGGNYAPNRYYSHQENLDLTASARTKGLFFTVTGKAFTSNGVDRSNFPDWDYKWNNSEQPYFDDAYYRNSLTNIPSGVNGSLISRDSLNHWIFKYPDLYTYIDTIAYNTDSVKFVASDYAIKKATGLDSANYLKNVRGFPNSYNDPTNNLYISGRLKIQDLTLGFQAWNAADGVGPVYTDNRGAGSSNGSMWTFRQYFLFLQYQKNITPWLNLTSFTRYKVHGIFPDTRLVSYRSYAIGGNTINDLMENRIPKWDSTFYHQLSKQLHTEIRAALRVSVKLSFITGLEFRNSDIAGDYITSTTNPNPMVGGLPKLVAGGNMYNSVDLGAYAQGTYMPYKDKKGRNPLLLTAGARIDNNRIRKVLGYGTVFNPRLAVVYTPNDRLILKAIYAEAFKDHSNFNYFSTSSSRKIPNPDLKPEKVRNIEIAGRIKLLEQKGAFRNFFLDVALYHAEYRNVLETVSITLSTGEKTTQFQDIGKVNVTGLQSELSIDAGKNLKISGNYTFTHPLDFKDSNQKVRVGDISKNSFNLIGNLTFAKEKLNFCLRANYVGAKLTGINTSVASNPYDKINAYLIFHSALSFQSPRKLPGLSFQVIVDNLTGQTYWHPGVRTADGIQYAPRTPQIGRLISLRIIYDFQVQNRRQL